jgi:hypothetical protein
MQAFYGQLQYTLKFRLPQLDNFPPRELIVALVKPCITNGSDATKATTYYDEIEQLSVVNLTCIIAAVGRVPMGGGRYGIVDRNTEEAWPSVHDSDVGTNGQR